LFLTKTFAPFMAQASEWKAHQARVIRSSIREDYFAHDSYRALVAMDKDEITPLVMAKYAQDQSGWWYELLNEIQTGKRSDAEQVNAQQEYAKWKNWFEGLHGEQTTPGA
jgi:hypothetical protein